MYEITKWFIIKLLTASEKKCRFDLKKNVMTIYPKRILRNFNNYVLQKGQHYFTVKKNKPRSHGTRLVCYFNILCYSFSVVSVCGSAIATAFFLMYGNTAKVTHVTIPAANTTSIATQRTTNNGDFASALTLTVVAVT